MTVLFSFFTIFCKRIYPFRKKFNKNFQKTLDKQLKYNIIKICYNILFLKHNKYCKEEKGWSFGCQKIFLWGRRCPGRRRKALIGQEESWKISGIPGQTFLFPIFTIRSEAMWEIIFTKNMRRTLSFSRVLDWTPSEPLFSGAD